MVRQFDESDFESIYSWYSKRNLRIPERESFPKIGYIVPGTAAGFMYQTDSNVAILESFISNKDKSTIERDLALKDVMESLITSAKSLNYKYVFGFSTSPTMIQRACEQGFNIQDTSSVTVVKVL